MKCRYLTMNIRWVRDNATFISVRNILCVVTVVVRYIPKFSYIAFSWYLVTFFHKENNLRLLLSQANIVVDTTLICEGPRQHTARRVISRSHPSSGDFFSSTCGRNVSSAMSVQIDHFRTFSADDILGTLFRHSFVCFFLLIFRQYLSGNPYSTAAVQRRNIPVLSPLLYKARD